MDNDLNTLSSTASLQTLCLVNLIDNLEFYSPEQLASIPTVPRFQLLSCCPIVDVCRLEKTSAFDGIDSEKLWGTLYNNHWEKSKFDFHTWVELMFETKHEQLSSTNVSNREKYFSLMTTAILCAERLVGTFVNDRGYPFRLDELPHVWVEKYCPTDFVNYLVATSGLKHVKKEVISEEDEKVEAGTYCPIPRCQLEGEEDDDEDKPLNYNSISIVTKNQHFPSRHMQMTKNETHLRDEEAIALLMDECNYYPNSIVLNNFGSIQWNWNEEAVCNLLMKFFCQVKDICLRFVGHDNTGYASSVLSCCLSSPVLSSVFVNLDMDLADVVTSILTSQHPTIAQPILKKFGILKFYTTEPCSYYKELAKILSCQNSLYELQLQGELPSDSDLLSSIIAIVSNPNFQRLSLERAEASLMFITKLLTAYLLTPCSNAQVLELCNVVISKHETEMGQQPSVRLLSEESSFEHKSLQWTHREWQAEFPKRLCDWLLSFKPLVLYNLCVDFDCLTSKSNMLGTLASNTALNVQSLKLNEYSLNLSEEYLEAILKNPSLNGLELGTKIESNDLILMANALRVQIQLGTLENLCLDISTMNKFDNIEPLFDVIFTLPQVSCFSLKLHVSWTRNSSEMIEALQQCWQKNGCKKLKRFCFEYCEGVSRLKPVHNTVDTHEMQLLPVLHQE